ncbi:Scr1 family TA system antitoxin-like transcriptional regulator [Streptomyces sp. st115]|uniref:Scr1 family TA system antitoxin-like transcriptional regulator n=1 Tax=Streptomyces sp. st115 TaxID=1828047 RepID=UPI000BF1C0BC|nr:Scr1 family TA system antitoxin-like transcriptional regulator [Streptomyces sp. st115]
MDTERTTIQVIPFEAGEYAGMNGITILLTLPDNSTTAHQEGGASGDVFDDRATVGQRLRDYDRTKACALSPEASATLIEAAMENLKPCELPQT